MSKLPRSGDYTDSFNPFVFAKIPEKSVCLDIGCWTGNLGKALIDKRSCIVDGIDVRKDVLATAKKNGYRTTFLINLNNETYSKQMVKGKYDVIICADILEHLINPVDVLKDFKSYLKPNGKVIISLPNVAFILNRLLLLFGKWDYTEFGTLDKTHLRFYTISSVQQMAEASGLKVKEVKPYNQFGILRLITPLTTFLPTLFAYQIMVIAEK